MYVCIFGGEVRPVILLANNETKIEKLKNEQNDINNKTNGNWKM